MHKEERVEDINLDILPIDGERMLKELADGNMVIARSKNDFLYIVEFDETFHMFSHRAGAADGGQQQFPKDEKTTAIVNKIADLSDAMFLAQFNKDHELNTVMYTAEEAILSMFPGDSRDSDETVDFMDFDFPKE